MSDPLFFSYPVKVRKLPRKGQHISYQAPEAVCSAIAEEYGLMKIVAFEGKAVLAPWKKDGVKITGTIKADVIQPCAVSGEPLDARVNEEFDALFVPDGSVLSKPKTNDEGEMIVDPYGDDLPETFMGDTLDVADIWMEFFVLGLNLFAKKDDVSFDDDAQRAHFGKDHKKSQNHSHQGQDDDKPISPFAVLAALKGDKQ